MSRLKNLDCLKAVAMFAVLVLHAPQTDVTRSTAWQFFNQFCRFAVPCFFLVSGFFFARSFQKAADGRKVILRYVSRLLVLFLFWAFFYAVVPPFGNDPPYPTPVVREHLEYIARHPRQFMIAGYALHLWFLSSLFQGIFLVGGCLYLRRPWVALAGGAVLFGVALLGAPYAHAVGWKWGFDMKEGPFYATLFVAIGALTAIYQWRLGVAAAALLAVAGLGIEWLEVSLLQDPVRGVTIASHDFTVGTLPFATGIFFLGLALPDAGPAWLARVGTYSLGVYAIHIYAAKVLGRSPAGAAMLVVPPLFLAAVYLIALAASMALARLPYARRLVT